MTAILICNVAAAAGVPVVSGARPGQAATCDVDSIRDISRRRQNPWSGSRGACASVWDDAAATPQRPQQ